MIIKNYIQEIRWNQKMTQRDLASKSGLSRATISNVENGIEDPKQSTMIAISRALKLPVETVFDLDWRK